MNYSHPHFSQTQKFKVLGILTLNVHTSRIIYDILSYVFSMPLKFINALLSVEPISFYGLITLLRTLHTPLYKRIFSSLECIIRSEIAGSYGKFMVSLLRTYRIVFHGSSHTL